MAQTTRVALKRPPAYSQYSDINRKIWQRRGCGIIALKSVMDYWSGKEIVSASHLFQQGLDLGGYLHGVGWKHVSLVQLAREYRFSAHRVDLKKFSDNEAMRHLRQELNAGPVIVSVWRKLMPRAASSHLIVVFRVHRGRVHYMDPANNLPRYAYKLATVNQFARGWKKRYIVIHPRKRKRSKPKE